MSMATEPEDFSYDLDERPRSGLLTASIYAGRAMREDMRADAEAAGLAIREAGPLQHLLGDGPDALGDVVLVDCPALTPVGLAALAASARGERKILLTEDLCISADLIGF